MKFLVDECLDSDLVNQVLEITRENDTLHVRRYRLPAADL